MLLRLLLGALVAGILSACAGLDVKPINSEADNNVARGFRYYQPAPFLFVYSDGKGGIISKIIYLPDTTQKMSIKPYAYLASNESTLQFDTGMLTQAAAVVDETVVPTAALDSLAKVLGTVAKAALNAPESIQEATVPIPYLFKIIIKGDNIELRGGPMSGAALDKDSKTKMIIRATIAKKEGN